MDYGHENEKKKFKRFLMEKIFISKDKFEILFKKTQEFIHFQVNNL